MDEKPLKRLKDILFTIECCHDSIMSNETQDDELEEYFNNVDVFLRAIMRELQHNINHISSESSSHDSESSSHEHSGD